VKAGKIRGKTDEINGHRRRPQKKGTYLKPSKVQEEKQNVGISDGQEQEQHEKKTRLKSGKKLSNGVYD